jgi:glutamyl-tRNA reductase
MRLGVIGINHKVATLEMREQVAARGCSEVSSVLLSTCNRTEVYFSCNDLAETQRRLLEHFGGGQEFYTFFGHDAFLHLARVAVGLDSALLFETEIQGQVKRGYEARMNRLPSHIHFAFQKALRIGKQVRGEFPIRSPDLAEAVARQVTGGRVLLVGASRTNRQVAQALWGRDLTICNRTPERAHQFGLSVLPWRQLERWREFDVVICATSAGRPLLTGDAGKVQLLIDLSVPRNIDPALGEQTRLLNIQQLQGSMERRACPLILAAADERVEQLVTDQLTRLKRKERRIFSAA